MLEALLRQGDILNGAALPTLPYASPARLFLDTLLEQCSGKLNPGQVRLPQCHQMLLGMLQGLTGCDTHPEMTREICSCVMVAGD